MEEMAKISEELADALRDKSQEALQASLAAVEQIGECRDEHTEKLDALAAALKGQEAAEEVGERADPIDRAVVADAKAIARDIRRQAVQKAARVRQKAEDAAREEAAARAKEWERIKASAREMEGGAKAEVLGSTSQRLRAHFECSRRWRRLWRPWKSKGRRLLKSRPHYKLRETRCRRSLLKWRRTSRIVCLRLRSRFFSFFISFIEMGSEHGVLRVAQPSRSCLSREVGAMHA